MMRRSPLKPSTKGLARTGIKPSRAPAAKVGVLGLSSFQRKAPARKAAMKPAKRGKATNAEREHMGQVAAMGCCLCAHLNYGHVAAEVHHVRVKHGWGRSGHMNTIGLCPDHHRGQPGGVHDMGRIQFSAHYGISEIELLERVTLHLNQNNKGELHGKF